MEEAEDGQEARNGQGGMRYLAFRIRPMTSLEVITVYYSKKRECKEQFNE